MSDTRTNTRSGPAISARARSAKARHATEIGGQQQLPTSWLPHASAQTPGDTSVGDVEAMARELVFLEHRISRLRIRQADLLRDVSGMPGARIGEAIDQWTAHRIDIAPATAADLVAVADAEESPHVATHRILSRLRDGELSLDRAVADIRAVEADTAGIGATAGSRARAG